MKTGKEMAIDVFAEIEMRQKKMKNTRKMPTIKVAIAVAVMICILCTSAVAVYRFTIPKQLEDDLGTKLINIQPILNTQAKGENTQIVSDITETDGCTVRFEAIADAETIRPVLKSGPDGIKTNVDVQDRFAVFTIKVNDKVSAEEKYNFVKNPVGYCIGVPGYMPNATTFDHLICDYYDSETNTLILACLINEIEAFADEKPYIALFSGSAYANQDFLRMNEEGQAYFTESYDGIKAVFSLPLDPSLADKEAKEKMLKTRAFIKGTDYSQSDKNLALDREFRESGADLSPFIGDNEWLGRYPLKFGEVKFSYIYLQHSNDWKNGKHRLLTGDEIDEIAGISGEKLFGQYGTDEKTYSELTKEEQIDYDIMIKEKTDSAVYCGGLPDDAEAITLPDGSKAYYCYGFTFLHINSDGRLSMVIIPNHKTVIEVFGIDAILNTEFIAYLYNSGQNTKGNISPITEYNWFIDNGGVDYDDTIINDNNRERVKSIYESDIRGMSEFDAEYETVSYWSAFPGTVEVIN